MKLWPHQERGLRLLREVAQRGGDHILVVAPCGAGKSVLGAEVCAGASRLENRVLWVADRIELINQVAEEFERYKLHVGIIQAARPQDSTAPIQIASIQTLARRSVPTGFDVIVFDEAHLHVGTKTPDRILKANPDADVIGLSGTPTRLDGTAMRTMYNSMVILAQPSELTAAGILVPLRAFGPSMPDLSGVRTVRGDYDQTQLEEACMKAALDGDIAKTFRQHCSREFGSHDQAILFAASVATSIKSRDALRAVGVNAVHLDAKTLPDERRSMLGRLKEGEPIVICNVRVLTTGFNYRALPVIIDAGPTQSEALFIQKTMRAARSSPGKKSALILDHAGNIAGRPNSHGWPNADRKWTLDGTPKSEREVIPSLRTCPSCFAILLSGTAICSECGHIFVTTPREIRQNDGELREVTKAPTRDERKDAFDALCLKARELRLGRGFVTGQYKQKFSMTPRFDWPAWLPEDLGKKRRDLERFAESSGRSASWVDWQMAKKRSAR